MDEDLPGKLKYSQHQAAISTEGQRGIITSSKSGNAKNEVNCGSSLPWSILIILNWYLILVEWIEKGTIVLEEKLCSNRVVVGEMESRGVRRKTIEHECVCVCVFH